MQGHRIDPAFLSSYSWDILVNTAAFGRQWLEVTMHIRFC